MASFDIQISRPAEKDLMDIKNYISKELAQPETAQKFLAKLSQKINNLEKMPFRNPVVKDERLSRLGIRKLLVDNFLVFYFVNEEQKTVFIVRVLYNKRRWESLI